MMQKITRLLAYCKEHPNMSGTSALLSVCDAFAECAEGEGAQNERGCVSVCKSILEMNKEHAEHYGYDSQSNQLVEECAELIQAVCTYRRAVLGLGQPVTEDKKAVAMDNFTEEIADVEIMLEQIKYLLQIPEEELEALKLFKVNRTRERMLQSANTN
jgi:NTP pyrophosphatase (non-canonical NTP hydrolase)